MAGLESGKIIAILDTRSFDEIVNVAGSTY